MTEARRAARRAAMPVVSALVEELAQWSPKVIYARENGITVGKQPAADEDSTFTVPANYFPMKTFETKGKK